MVLAKPQQVVGAERKPALADTFRQPLKIGKIIARHFLMRADKQMRELPPGGAGLCQQLGIAACSSSFENRNAGSSGTPARRRRDARRPWFQCPAVVCNQPASR